MTKRFQTYFRMNADKGAKFLTGLYKSK